MQRSLIWLTRDYPCPCVIYSLFPSVLTSKIFSLAVRLRGLEIALFSISFCLVSMHGALLPVNPYSFFRHEAHFSSISLALGLFYPSEYKVAQNLYVSHAFN